MTTAPKWGRVSVAWKHPRTGSRGMYPGIVVARRPSGRFCVALVIEGRTYRVEFDPADIHPAPLGTGESA